LSLAWPYKTKRADPELLVEIIHHASRIGRKNSSLHPTKRKTTSPSLTRTRQKNNLSTPSLSTTPKRRKKIIYKQQNYHSLLGRRETEGSPPPFSHLKEAFFEKRKKSPWGERGVGSLFRSFKKKKKKKRTIFKYVSHQSIFIIIKKKKNQNQKYFVKYTAPR